MCSDQKHLYSPMAKAFALSSGAMLGELMASSVHPDLWVAAAARSPERHADIDFLRLGATRWEDWMPAHAQGQTRKFQRSHQ